jgi:hypothetical protein
MSSADNAFSGSFRVSSLIDPPFPNTASGAQTLYLSGPNPLRNRPAELRERPAQLRRFLEFPPGPADSPARSLIHFPPSRLKPAPPP